MWVLEESKVFFCPWKQCKGVPKASKLDLLVSSYDIPELANYILLVIILSSDIQANSVSGVKYMVNYVNAQFFAGSGLSTKDCMQCQRSRIC